MASRLHNLSDYDLKSVPCAKGLKVGIVVSEWNGKITGSLLQGACDTLLRHGVEDDDILVQTVPGSFELVFGSAQMVKSGLVDAVIAIGCVLNKISSISVLATGAVQAQIACITSCSASGKRRIISFISSLLYICSVNFILQP